jgi:pimeloyl-ACP methyl ester carboxylesterase
MTHGIRRSACSPAALALSAAALVLRSSLLFAEADAPMAQPTEWHSTEIHGHRMFYATRGSGPTLVFLHGGGDSGEHSFVRQLDVFSEHHHIVAPDQVGQGRTPDVPGPLSYTAMMEDTAKLLQELKLKHVDVVGFSDGGILALMLAVRHPELVRRLVISGVNISPEGLVTENLQGLRADDTPTP